MEELVERIKDQVANSRGFPDWKTMQDFTIDHNTPVVVAQILVPAMDRVAQLCLDAIGKPMRFRNKKNGKIYWVINQNITDKTTGNEDRLSYLYYEHGYPSKLYIRSAADFDEKFDKIVNL